VLDSSIFGGIGKAWDVWATALLLEAAMDSGLSPHEARRAIAGGVKHGSRAA